MVFLESCDHPHCVMGRVEVAGYNVIGGPNKTIWSWGEAVPQKKRGVMIAGMKKGKFDRQKYLCPLLQLENQDWN